MKNSLTILIGTLMITTSFPIKAEGRPSLTYIGHATVLIEGRACNFMTDPFFGSEILLGLKRKIPPASEPHDLPSVDFVLISHTHPDHFDIPSLERLRGKPTVFMPWKRGKKLKRLGFGVIELKPWQEYNEGRFKITAVPARHMWGNCLGYLIEMEGHKIYFTGDTKIIKKACHRLKDEKVEVMLLPYGGVPVVGSIWTSAQAAEAISIIQPHAIIPVHWGTFDRWWTSRQSESPQEFIEFLKSRSPNVKGLLLKGGDSLELFPLRPNLEIEKTP